MHFYFAPLEGITTYIYRNSHHAFYAGAEKYFTPFLSPNQNRSFGPKDLKDILPEHNENINIVPQLLTNNAEYFIQAAKGLWDYGYEEVNLNLGCPSGTVTAKGKGAGFLAKQKELDEFLEEIFNNVPGRVSVKTRIGKDSPDEFYELIDIFNKYPISELIIHPRVQTDFYKNSPNRKVFKDALALSKNRLCYNGDIFTAEAYKEFCEEFSETEKFNTVMIGRGLLLNPGLIEEICEKEVNDEKTVNDEKIVNDKKRLKEFHDRIYMDYKNVISGDVNVLFKMKELWFYMAHSFTNPDKYLKKIKKSTRVCDYETAVRLLFEEQEIV